MKCRICNDECHLLEEKVDFLLTHRVYKNTTEDATFQSVDLFQCKHCKHIQIENIMTDDYYVDYNSNYGANGYFEHFNATEQYIEKIKHYSEGQRIFEIGSGSGSALKIAKNYFDEVIGVEPAKNLYELCLAEGLNVFHGYFDEQSEIGSEYDAFMTFQVFEHLEDPVSVLKAAYHKLKSGGIGFVNVPNGGLIVQNAIFHQLILEHINYFSIESLIQLAKDVGFDVIAMDSNEDTMELNLYLRKPKEIVGFRQALQSISQKLESILADTSNVALWGAGGRCVQYYTLLPKHIKIEYFFDGSAEKQGLYALGIPHMITQPNHELLKTIDCVIILASAYNRQIIEGLREEYCYEGEIVYFDGNEVLTDIANTK